MVSIRNLLSVILKPLNQSNLEIFEACGTRGGVLKFPFAQQARRTGGATTQPVRGTLFALHHSRIWFVHGRAFSA